MKNKLKYLYIVMAVVMAVGIVFSCVGCDKGEGEGNKVVETAKLTIAGNDISLYTIVYAEDEYTKTGKDDLVFGEHDFYRWIAEEVQKGIEDLTGVTLSIAKDKDKKKGGFEILVGKTNRSESSVYSGDMSVYQYVNRVKNGKLTLGGGYDTTSLTNGIKTGYAWAATYHAFDYLKRYVVNRMIKGEEEIDLREGFYQSGTVELTTIACVGDSITEGWGSTDWNVCSYPAAMQRALWKDYVVLNYGASGRTMRNDLADRYVNTEFYNAAVEHGENFDIVLLMLGTNDSDRDPVFDQNDDKIYNDSALEIAAALENKRDKLPFVIMNCPAYYGGGNSGSSHVRALQDDLPTLFEEKGYTCHFFDMHSFTDRALTHAHYPDALHPDDEGYSMMGVKLAEIIPEIVG